MESALEIGPHRFSRQGDVIRARFSGQLMLTEVEALRLLMHSVRDEHGRCYMLANAGGLTGIAVEARKVLSEWGKSNPEDRISGVGVFGISFTMRALSMMTLGAVNFMSRRPMMIHFAGNEAEAQAWIDERRVIDGGAASTA